MRINELTKKGPDFEKKKVLVMGLGLHGGGVGVIRYLYHRGAHMRVTDLRSKSVLRPSLKKVKNLKNIRFILGRHRAEDILWADCIVKNPGVPPHSPFLRFAKKHRIPITSDIEIFFSQCPAPIIGVTGTRGKSTTAHLIAEFLRKKQKRVFLGGNIRTSVLEFLDRIKPHDLVVLELSSFQLQSLAGIKKSPSIAVLTNILRDHVNWHRSMAKYKEAKRTILKFQKRTGSLFIPAGEKTVQDLIKNSPSTLRRARLPKKFISRVDHQLGKHYRPSVALAIAVARHLGVTNRDIARVLKNFHGLPGRQETVANIRGVHCINDTTATTPDAAIAALERFGAKKRGKLILIAGGQDKKLLFSDFACAIKRFADVLVLLPGTATDKIIRIMNQESRIKNKILPMHTVQSMADALRVAWKNAYRGDSILLSPGAASFGLFTNEFDRGDAYRKEIHP